MKICKWTVLLFVLPVAGCGNSVEGLYTGVQDSWLEKIDFRDEQRVELTFMGMTKEGTYEVEEDRVRINNGGDISILRIEDDGCLNGGDLLGRYCKSGASSSASSGSKASSSGKIAGNRYAFGPSGDEMVFEFLDAASVRLTIDGESENLRYEEDGDEIIIEGLDGTNWVFTRRGNDLEGGPEGASMVFRKRS